MAMAASVVPDPPWATTTSQRGSRSDCGRYRSTRTLGGWGPRSFGSRARSDRHDQVHGLVAQPPRRRLRSPRVRRCRRTEGDVDGGSGRQPVHPPRKRLPGHRVERHRPHRVGHRPDLGDVGRLEESHSCHSGATSSAPRRENSIGNSGPRLWAAQGMPAWAAATGPARSVTSWTTSAGPHSSMTATRSATLAGPATAANICAAMRRWARSRLLRAGPARAPPPSRGRARPGRR